MAPTRFLQPPTAPVGRHRQVQEAKDMERAVLERARRDNVAVPPYEFLELIGKGSFGRVFKSRRKNDNKILAVKIMDVDTSDYQLNFADKDIAIKDFWNEINILQTLKDADAKNINIIYDAFSFHSQLWIVSEYCPGGSVHTLMKACKPGPGLAERYIIAISRELAIALKHVHAINVIHRDLKAANILITEDGQLQLCDFGVSGAIESNVGKRSTIIGTPFWMAPEMHNDGAIPNGYGTEVDCWAFGCTVYELATGLPPNARIHPRKLGIILQKAPVLQGDRFSDGLKEFVSFCLEERPEKRPAARDILNHPYIRDSAERYPTIMLKELIEDYARWESSGGQRASLFNPYGAQGPSPLDELAQDDEWNFSTTAEFDKSFFAQNSAPSVVINDANSRSRHGSANMPSPFDRTPDVNAAIRGGSAMAAIFDQDANPYQYSNGEAPIMAEPSDLPLRKFSADYSANRLTMIDLDFATPMDMSSVDFAEVPTIRGRKNNPMYDEEDEVEPQSRTFYLEPGPETSKRDTIAWTFPPSVTVPANPAESSATAEWTMEAALMEANFSSHSADDTLLSAPTPKASQLATFRPHLTHSVTEPLGTFNNSFMHPFEAAPPRLANSPDRFSAMLDLDAALIPRPSTAASTATNFTDVTTGDPWDLDLDVDMGTVRNRQSLHMHSQSEPLATHEYDSHHDRGGSMSSDTDYERGRALSVKASADSLRTAMTEDEPIYNSRDDYWHRGRDGTHRRLEQTNQPMYDAAIGDIFKPKNRQPAYNPDTNVATPSERDLPNLTLPRLEQPSFPVTSDGMSGSTLRSRRGSRGRRPRLAASNTGARRVIEGFPEPRAPNPAALEEGASPELVMSELSRLLGDFGTALRMSADFLAGGDASIEEEGEFGMDS